MVGAGRLRSYAQAYDLSLAQAAHLIVSKAQEFQTALIGTEIEKDRLAGRARRAGSMADLNLLRAKVFKI